jgi:hypothetical protein
MKKYLIIRLIIALSLSFAFILGCVPKTRIIRTPPKPEVIVPPSSPITILDDDIAFLERILRKRELIHEDTEMAEDLLSAYMMVRDYFLRKGTYPNYDRLIQKLYETLTRLDHHHFLKREIRKPLFPETITVFSEVQDMIRNKYFSGDYLGVVTDTMVLKNLYGPDTIPLDIEILFAVSLAKRGRLEEAAIAGETILLELHERPDLAFILTQIKEAIRDKFFSGDYQGVIDDTIELNVIFGPDSIPVDIGFLLAVSLIEVGMKEEANILGSRLIREFETRRDLAFLQNLLIEWQLDLENREIVLQIYRELRSHMDDIMEEFQTNNVTEGLFKDLIAQRIQREREARLVYEEEALIWARELIEEERYEETIQRINELGNDQDISLEMKELRDLAIEGFIDQEIDRAAADLLKGRQATDPFRKKEFFLLSYHRLRASAEQYPQSSRIETLNEYLEIVETKLNELEYTMEDSMGE